MNEAEQYEFDLNGYIIYRNVLSEAEQQKLNELIDAYLGKSERVNFPLLDIDPYFFELMAKPKTLSILRYLLGDWLRFDHAFGIQVQSGQKVPQGLHGGPRHHGGIDQYHWVQGKIYCGLVGVSYSLVDVEPGDGGFVCVPGSHKTNLPYAPPINSHLVQNPKLCAGDMIIFTEALTHGYRIWRGKHRRRALVFKYSPGYAAAANYDSIAQYYSIAFTDVQRDLLRPPSVAMRAYVRFPD